MICSAVLFHTKRFGFSFQMSTRARMSAAGSTSGNRLQPLCCNDHRHQADRSSRRDSSRASQDSRGDHVGTTPFWRTSRDRTFAARADHNEEDRTKGRSCEALKDRTLFTNSDDTPPSGLSRTYSAAGIDVRDHAMAARTGRVMVMRPRAERFVV